MDLSQESHRATSRFPGAARYRERVERERARGRRPGAAGRDWSDLFLLLEVFFLTGTTAATRGLDTAAAWLAVPLSRAVSILIAARLLVAAVTLVVSHVTSSLLWWAIERSARLQLPCQ